MYTKYFFPQISEKHINLFKKEMEVHETAMLHHMHIHLSSTILHIQIIGKNTGQYFIYFCYGVLVQLLPGGYK